MEYLSDEWITAFDRAVADHAGLAAASADRSLAIEFTVSMDREPGTGSRSGPGPGPGSNTDGAAPASPDRVYALILDHGTNRVVAGPHPDATITLRTDLATAAAIAAHVESAQTAFMSGRLRLGGDVRVLMANQDLLAGIDDCTAAVRADTGFGELAPTTPADA